MENENFGILPINGFFEDILVPISKNFKKCELANFQKNFVDNIYLHFKKENIVHGKNIHLNLNIQGQNLELHFIFALLDHENNLIQRDFMKKFFELKDMGILQISRKEILKLSFFDKLIIKKNKIFALGLLKVDYFDSFTEKKVNLPSALEDILINEYLLK